MSDKKLPDDAPDRMLEHGGIDGLIGSPAGPDILRESEANKQRADQAELHLKLLVEKYSLDEDDSFEELCRTQVDQEVYNRQEWAVSEEGQQALREGVMEEWSTEPKGRDSHQTYMESFEARGKRLAAEEKARKEQD